MKLNELRDNPGARKNRKRLGRGVGSTKGKTAGRGHKGAKARAGGGKKIFEGGQMPIYRRLPKQGFKGITNGNWKVINLSDIQGAVETGKIDPYKTITEDYLYASGITNKKDEFVKMLGNGEVKSTLNFLVADASRSAVKKILQAGGTISTYHETPGRSKTTDSSDLLLSSDVDKSLKYELKVQRDGEERLISFRFYMPDQNENKNNLNDLELIITSDDLKLPESSYNLGRLMLNTTGKASPSVDIHATCKTEEPVIDLYILYKNNLVQRRRISIP